jgi:hypothetical protein
MRFWSTLCLIILIAAVTPTVGAEKPPIMATHKNLSGADMDPRRKAGSLLYRFTGQVPEMDKIKISGIHTYRVDNWKPTPKVKSVVLEGDEARRFSEVWWRLNDGLNLGCFSPA